MGRQRPARSRRGLLLAGLVSVVAVLSACRGVSLQKRPDTPIAGNAASTAVVSAAAVQVPLHPEAHARLAAIVAEVQVRAVHPITRLSEFNMLNTPSPASIGGRLVEMTVIRRMKPDYPLWPTLLIAVVPDDLESAVPAGNKSGADPYAVGTREFVFFTSWYRGPGDSDCRRLTDADPSYGQAVCGFAVPYAIDADWATSSITGLRMPLTELEHAIARGVQPRRPTDPEPWPAAESMTSIDGIHYGVDGALQYGSHIVAEVEVTDEEPPLYNTETGDVPPAPPGRQTTLRVDDEEWDIRQVVELAVIKVFAGDPTLTDLVTVVPGEPDNPYEPTTGMEPPPLPLGMRGVVAFDTEIWPSGNPTHYQRRALNRVDAINAAGGRAQFVMPVPSSAAYFVGPYAIEGMGRVWRIPDLRSDLERIAGEPAIAEASQAALPATPTATAHWTSQAVLAAFESAGLEVRDAHPMAKAERYTDVPEEALADAVVFSVTPSNPPDPAAGLPGTCVVRVYTASGGNTGPMASGAYVRHTFDPRRPPSPDEILLWYEWVVVRDNVLLHIQTCLSADRAAK